MQIVIAILLFLILIVLAPWMLGVLIVSGVFIVYALIFIVIAGPIIYFMVRALEKKLYDPDKERKSMERKAKKITDAANRANRARSNS